MSKISCRMTDRAIAEYNKLLEEWLGDKSDVGSPPTATDPVLGVSYFKKVARPAYDFDRYVSATKGFTDAEWAFQQQERIDHFQTNSGPFYQK